MGTVQVAMLAGAPYAVARCRVHSSDNERGFWECCFPACSNDVTRLSRNAITRKLARNNQTDEQNDQG